MWGSVVDRWGANLLQVSGRIGVSSNGSTEGKGGLDFGKN